ncbi:MAG: hypothetical protein L0Z50_21155 [Verrucomicrobiales bacterium]|nr:hypothetical protein [Verrucomicrobiales bacterium]
MACIAGWENLLLASAVSALLLAVVSFIDDLNSISPGLRFSCHAIAALSTLYFFEKPKVELGLLNTANWPVPAALVMPVLFLWITGYTNAFNFMDGLNGLAAGQAVVTSVGSALIAGVASGNWNSPPVLACFVVAGTASGFLPHNFPRARMFMGDVSSAPLGYLLAVLAIWIAAEHGWWLVVPLVLLHTNFVLDTAITLIRRILNGRCWHAAHREHFYQRLNRAGRSHAFVTGCEMALQVVGLLLLLAYVGAEAPARLGLVAAIIGIWLSFFVFCEGQFQHALKNRVEGTPAAT